MKPIKAPTELYCIYNKETKSLYPSYTSKPNIYKRREVAIEKVEFLNRNYPNCYELWVYTAAGEIKNE